MYICHSIKCNIYIYIYIYLYTHSLVHIYIYIYIFNYIYSYIYIYIYIYIHIVQYINVIYVIYTEYIVIFYCLFPFHIVFMLYFYILPPTSRLGRGARRAGPKMLQTRNPKRLSKDDCDNNNNNNNKNGEWYAGDLQPLGEAVALGEITFLLCLHSICRYHIAPFNIYHLFSYLITFYYHHIHRIYIYMTSCFCCILLLFLSISRLQPLCKAVALGFLLFVYVIFIT